MPLEKNYQPGKMEPELQNRWQANGTYHFAMDEPRPLYAIDTPPATVSGHLHLGHVYSYSHADFMARFFRMRGYKVFYPMGFDDNGLPTEHYVEKKLKKTAAQIGRQAFIDLCLQESVEAEKEYRALWDRLGLSVDWRYTYRTIDEHSRRCSQHSFLDLYHKGLAYRAQAPMIWCPECHTAIAQADLEDRERSTEFVTLPFRLENGEALPIATTRPELLAACVAVFVHPADLRYQPWIGRQVSVPLYGQAVPVLADPAAEPEKGTGAVMCCTFGDQADVAWWYSHKLPLIVAIDENGKMRPLSGAIAGLEVDAARSRIKELLAEQGLILARQPTTGTIRVHERCETPVEFQVTAQWFIRVLENKAKFIELGQQIHWHPAHMQARYQAWVENLNWDWCISRQRYYGVSFPVWYCKACGAIQVAEESQLPVDPSTQGPSQPCACGSMEFIPETDIMDTWATSSVSPEIVAGWLDEPEKFSKLFPQTLRPQASEIIRTWAFYSIVKSYYHFGVLPWSDALISGWGLAAAGAGKISKSKGGGPMAPMEMIQRYSADAVRYWAASTTPGKDSVISEEKIQMGAKLATKLWNVARFAEPFILAEQAAEQARPPGMASGLDCFTPADRWMLASLSALVEKATSAFEGYDYASAKTEIENFFWRNLTDNYLEMAKQRLYDPQHPGHAGAQFTFHKVFKTLLKLLAPLLPYVTETIWQALFAAPSGSSIHQEAWPQKQEAWPQNDEAETFTEKALTETQAFGELLVDIATAARRYKSEHSLSLGSVLDQLHLVTTNPELAQQLKAAEPDLTSVTRARQIEVSDALEPGLMRLNLDHAEVEAWIQP